MSPCVPGVTQLLHAALDLFGSPSGGGHEGAAVKLMTSWGLLLFLSFHGFYWGLRVV